MIILAYLTGVLTGLWMHRTNNLQNRWLLSGEARQLTRWAQQLGIGINFTSRQEQVDVFLSFH